MNNMTIQQAIQKAIEGGWNGWKKETMDTIVGGMDEEGKSKRVRFGDKLIQEYSKDRAIFLDPLFWQSLGKAMGWEKSQMMTPVMSEFHCINCKSTKVQGRFVGWKFHWYMLVDHLAEGSSIESYFETL